VRIGGDWVLSIKGRFKDNAYNYSNLHLPPSGVCGDGSHEGEDRADPDIQVSAPTDPRRQPERDRKKEKVKQMNRMKTPNKITPMPTPRRRRSEWLSVKEATEWLGLTSLREQRAFRKAVTLGHIPAMKLTGQTIRIHRDDLRSVNTPK
jgi:excisionase family DNA binding protein